MQQHEQRPIWRREPLWLIAAGLLWLEFGTGGGWLALVLASVPGLLMLGAGVSSLLWPGDPRERHFGAAGAFLGVAYFALYYALITVVVLSKSVLISETAALKPERAAGACSATARAASRSRSTARRSARAVCPTRGARRAGAQARWAAAVTSRTRAPAPTRWGA